MSATEKIRKEKWIDEKTKKIKEMTVKGKQRRISAALVRVWTSSAPGVGVLVTLQLSVPPRRRAGGRVPGQPPKALMSPGLSVSGLEPEIQKLISKHKQELKSLRTLHETELQQADERAAQRCAQQRQELRAQLQKEKEEQRQREQELAKHRYAQELALGATACLCHREIQQQQQQQRRLCSFLVLKSKNGRRSRAIKGPFSMCNRYEKQLQDEEVSLQQQRRRLYKELVEEKEQLAQLASR